MKISGGRHALLASSAALVLLSTAAAAQTPAPGGDVAEEAAAEEGVDKSEIVVTGTLLRGIAPTGSEPLVLNRDDAVATGADSTAQLLANVPQLSDFNERPINRGVFNVQQTVNHPELRNLVGGIAGGGSATLLLLDGHRLPGMGVRQTIPDSDVITPGAIERVEIVTDGGSAIYGADAVGGVVNYQIRRRFDGVEADASYGFADDYQSVSANLTAGKDWGSGSAYVSYSFGWHDEIFAGDRDYARRRNYQLDVPFDLTCNPGNVLVTAGGVTSYYTLPNFTPATEATANRCDLGDTETMYPRETRHSVFAAFTQELTDSLEFNVHGFYTNRVNLSNSGDLVTSYSVRPVTVNPLTGVPTTTPNPFYRPVVPGSTATQSVQISWASVLGYSTMQRTELSTWGITPSLKLDLGPWQVRAMFNYGFGRSEYKGDDVNSAAFGALAGAGQVNPYNLADPVNAPLLPAILDYRLYGLGLNELVNTRVVAEGPLFQLPGGEMRLAIGAEYSKENFQTFSGFGSRNSDVRPRGAASRDTKALFFEALFPLFGEPNRKPGGHSLVFSASGRYDHYSDFGGTFNPKLAVTYQPVDWITTRANWGTSYQAPSLADGAGASQNTITVLPTVFFPAPAPFPAPVPGQVQIFLGGGGASLRPQTANTWSVGSDIKPPFVPGLTLSATYYNVKFKDLIAIPPVQNASIFYTQFPEYYTINPSTSVLQQYQAAASNPAALNLYINNPSGVYVIADGRRSNLSSIHTSGIDFSADYRRPTSFGSIFASFAGNYVLSRKVQSRSGQAFTESAQNSSRLNFLATLGAEVGNLRGQVTVSHSGGSAVTGTPANLFQTHLDSYTLVNLFFKYDLKGLTPLLEETSLTLNVDNLFDTDPPLLRTVDGFGGGFGNGFTLGRYVKFGVRTKF